MTRAPPRGLVRNAAGASECTDDQGSRRGDRQRGRQCARDPFAARVVRIVLIVIGCAIALYLLWRVRTVVRLAGISLFLALAIVPVVDALERRVRIPRAVIILVVLRGLIATRRRDRRRRGPEHGQGGRSARPGTRPDMRVSCARNSTFRHYDNRYHISPKLVQDARTAAAVARATSPGR